MYALSSQRRYWTFGSDKEIDELRQQQNQNFILKATRGHEVDVNNCVDYIQCRMQLWFDCNMLIHSVFSGEQFHTVLSHSQRRKNSIEKL